MNMPKRRVVRFTRDGFLFAVGIAGIAYETLVSNAERPTLLLLFAGMIGVTQFIRSDEKALDKRGEDKG